MQRLHTLAAGLVSGSLSVAPLLSIPTIITNLHDDLSYSMLSSSSSTYNEDLTSSIACFICKYRELCRLLPWNTCFVLTYGRHLGYVSVFQ
ncbi:hypothetical protein F4604DRAFT_1741883 [Suillus subluteus]|nr:hypothetical protein F4604DRAFT_1741883 [Suillus subluteus]